MSGNKWWYTKVGAKLLSDLVIFSILSSDIPLDFHDSIRVVPVKYLVHFLAVIKYFAPLITLNLSISSFLNLFVVIALILKKIFLS